MYSLLYFMTDLHDNFLTRDLKRFVLKMKHFVLGGPLACLELYVRVLKLSKASVPIK